MLIGLFLVYLAVFVAALTAIDWLSGFLMRATPADQVTFIAALAGGIAVVVLARCGYGGVTIAVAIVVFWSFLLFATDYASMATTLVAAALVLCAAAAAAVFPYLLRRRAR